ncbi:MAG: glutamate formimidoyltransferase [Bacteroidia bacterium]|nr:glutamate formimidoyltransferase [Bacteroidia bacterium]
MNKKIIECVPNFSEGRNLAVIKQITDVIEAVEGVKLLNVDPGAATNRTVVTFVGEPQCVSEAAFRAIKKASEVIDMRHHTGEHPRMGATDVCPMIPIAGVTMEECVEYARALAKRVGDELGIPVYCYENAAFSPERKNLANCRQGEYEGLAKKFEKTEWKPDFGPSVFNALVAQTGATAIGARDFLIAINYNLNTTSTRRANAIAYDVREKGRKKREGNPITGKVVKDANGNDVWTPGSLKGCKAIGWYIEEYGVAQVSMNVTDINATPVHIAFDEVVSKAAARGVRVTGSEIVGLVPKKVLIDAGKYFLAKQQRSAGIAEEDIIKIAVKSMGLDDLRPFDPKEKVIEYLIEGEGSKKLVDLTCRGFALETASESTAPGGGSVSALMGSLGAALGTMVANLSSHKPGWDDRWQYFAEWAEKGQKIIEEMLYLVDEDTNSFKRILDAFGLPKGSESEKEARSKAIQEATLYATEIPLRTMQVAFSAFDLAEAMVKEGNPNSVSDAGVGALALRAAVFGGYMNVRINSSDLKDREKAAMLVKEAQQIMDKAMERERKITSLVLETLEK